MWMWINNTRKHFVSAPSFIWGLLGQTHPDLPLADRGSVCVMWVDWWEHVLLSCCLDSVCTQWVTGSPGRQSASVCPAWPVTGFTEGHWEAEESGAPRGHEEKTIPYFRYMNKFLPSLAESEESACSTHIVQEVQVTFGKWLVCHLERWRRTGSEPRATLSNTFLIGMSRFWESSLPNTNYVYGKFFLFFWSCDWDYRELFLLR